MCSEIHWTLGDCLNLSNVALSHFKCFACSPECVMRPKRA